MGIRPEDVALTTGGGPGALPARVYIQEPLGSDLFLTLEVAGQHLKARVSPDVAVDVGEALQTTFNERRLHLFDAEGEALTA